ncbi:DUF2809 domain-containing protein [Asaia sp. HN010]|uniref:ribosomal maturation YjgA family protein n=1 Tax=Asaia sp. HN010 TaxID=3081233 RepID=UPI0030181E6B
MSGDGQPRFTFRKRKIAAFMIGIVTVGLICRLAPIGLDPWARKWSGSVLWGALFWCVAALVTSPERRVMRFLVGALGVAASEWLKMVHLAPLDALRKTETGGFLLGRIFSWRDLCAYIVGLVFMELMSLLIHLRTETRSRTEIGRLKS